MAEWHISSLVQSELREEVKRRKIEILRRYADSLVTMIENNDTADECLKKAAEEFKIVLREIRNSASNLHG